MNRRILYSTLEIETIVLRPVDVENLNPEA